MPRRPSSRKETVPPTMSPHQATPLIRRQIERAQVVMDLRFDSPQVDAWKNTTINILNAVYGMPGGELHQNTHEFQRGLTGVPFHAGMADSEIQEIHVRQTQKRRVLLEAYLEQLQDLAPPAAAAAPDQYRFHPEIERVSGELHRDSHYKQAALEAYIRVIEEVRAKSGLALDGDPLMNHAFGCDKQTPVIRFNSLETEPERDEQRGLMFLYKGVVGLRNSKAHSNRLLDDPSRAHEYLALTSLLMRLLEIAAINETQQR
jgi:uncharacterized protein (TIGR02391 family)